MLVVGLWLDGITLFLEIILLPWGYLCSARGEASCALGGLWYITLTLTGDPNSLTYQYILDTEGSGCIDSDFLTVGAAITYHNKLYIITGINVTEKTITFDKTIDSENQVSNLALQIPATISIGKYSIAHRGVAKGNSSISMGRGNTAIGNYSQAFGNTNITNNNAEFATGTFNKSNSGTVFSIGNGTSDNDRKNLVEIMKDGSVYYQNVGGYDGTNPTVASSVQQEIAKLKETSGKMEWKVWK